MKQFKALLLDLDNTLYNYALAHEAALQGFADFMLQHCQTEEKIALKAYDTARQRVGARLQGTAASHHRLLYFQGVCEILNLPATKFALQIYEVYWQTFLRHMQLYPGVLDFLADWKKLNKRICIVTDLTAHIQFRKIAQLQIEPFVDFIVTSEETGFDKPHASMFTLALEKLNLSASEVLMMGDHAVKDIQGAATVGIMAMHVHDNFDFTSMSLV